MYLKQCFYIRLTITHYIKKTNYKNDTPGGMLCHNNPAAYTYKESFTLYSKPQKGMEGIKAFEVLPKGYRCK